MIFNIKENDNSIIKVIGVGGGGSNAVNHMYKEGIVGVDFAICNTDNQAMEISPVPIKLQLGPALTEGRGAGSKPTIGKEACVESIEEVKQYFGDATKMLFVTAGMGGGTGTGAAPVIAKAAQEMDILTVGIVTIPFTFEGRRRMAQAMEGLEELKKNVDTLVVISNDKIRQMHGNLKLSEAFAQADNVLTVAAKGIAEIITVPGYVNVDFEDVNTVMRGSGVAIMGVAEAQGENRAKKAVEDALNSPLLEDNDIRGAKFILLNISSGSQEVTMDEIFEITEYIQDEAEGTDVIWGNCYDETLGEKLCVTVIATGFDGEKKPKVQETKTEQRTVVNLDDDVNLARDAYKEGDNAVTFEFGDVYNKKQDEPFVKEEGNAKPMDRSKLRTLSVKLNDPHTLNEIENEPAYLRRKVVLDDVPHSSEKNTSKWTVSGKEGEKPELNKDNAFLDKKVD